MVSEAEADEGLRRQFQELGSGLNVDQQTATQAWENFAAVRADYALEGDTMHWIACAFYVACRSTPSLSTGWNSSSTQGVSLTKLLRMCKLSLTLFFNKSKQWADMANMSKEFRSKIETLERNFAVSYDIFKKFVPIFRDMFKASIEEPSKHKSRKHSIPCTPARVMEFTWTLYVTVKSERSMFNDNLVDSYQLLLACCDFVYSNAVLADRRDILNPNFKGLPENFNKPDYVKPQSLCILRVLCELHDGIVVDATVTREYCWKKIVRKLFERQVLKGDAKTFSGIFDPANFDQNYKSINKTYDMHIMMAGNFDEKIFLAEYRRLRLLHKQQANSGGPRPALRDLNSGDEALSVASTSPKKLQQQYGDQQMQVLIPHTPLTGRKYLNSKDPQYVTPLITATQSVIRLQSLLSNRTTEPSEVLLAFFSACGDSDPAAGILAILQAMGERFCAVYATQEAADQSTNYINYAQKHLKMARTLFYKILEDMLVEETERNPSLDVQCLLDRKIYIECLFGCCLEIVIHSYNSHHKFPWILEALHLEAFHFYKVIELIVRTKDQLSRDVVKHLNSIEEQMLESIAWKSGSPLWENLENSGLPPPSCADTSLTIQGDDASVTNNRSIVSPSNASPISSISERFLSPIANSPVKKKLFNEPSKSAGQSTSAVLSGQSLLQSTGTKTMLVVLDQEGNQKLIPVTQSSELVAADPISDSPPSPTTMVKPKRGGSLGLFFRKFYNLACVRMKELCRNLNTSEEIISKIWTCFEFTIIEHPYFMKDRHLDQLLMCAVYVAYKASRSSISFTDIMKYYRFQPQADSHVYRSVLMDKTNGNQDDSSEKRVDLITFYNVAYVPKMQSFVMKFSHHVERESVPLSPLPTLRCLVSPKRRVLYNVFVKPFEVPSSSGANVNSAKLYYFNRSPSKDLHDINNVVQHGKGKKRLLIEDEESRPTNKINRPNTTLKLQGLIEERLGQSKE